MKSTVHIIPETNSSQHLICEIGWNGAAFVWINDAQKVDGIANYVFNETYPLNKEEQLREIINTFDSFNGDKNLFYNFPESVLVPDKFFNKSDAASVIEVMYPSLINCDILTENTNGIANIYAVPSLVHDFVLQKNIPYKHSSSCQLNGPDGVYCIFYYNSFKIIFQQYGRLHFIQQFNFHNSQEAAYHILNVCRQHELDVEEEVIRIAGIIDDDSLLYKEINKFFNVRFASVEHLEKAETLSAYPDHFFQHLISLVSCVS